MARSFDIATFDPSDGVLNEQLRRKLNGNFQRLCSLVGTESPVVVRGEVTQSVQEWARGWVAEYVDDYFESHLQQVVDEAVSESFDSAYPVGCVVVTTTASDPRLARGQWQQVGAGRYVRAAGDGVPVMSEGGSDEVTLTGDNLPEHSHPASVGSAGGHSHAATLTTSGAHSHSGTAASAGNHSHLVTVASDGSHVHQVHGGWGAGNLGDGWFRADGNNPSHRWSTTEATGAHRHGASASMGGEHSHSVSVGSAGGHSHSVSVSSGGEHSHQVTVSPSGSKDPRPVPIEPGYLALLFYRRVQ